MKKDQDLQLFLISLIEIKIDIETIMLNNFGLYKNYKDNNKKPIVDYLNKVLEKYGDKVQSREAAYTIDNLPDISEITPNRTLDANKYYEPSENDGDGQESNALNNSENDDEFERLLNEFINSSSEDSSSSD